MATREEKAAAKAAAKTRAEPKAKAEEVKINTEVESYSKALGLK